MYTCILFTLFYIYIYCVFLLFILLIDPCQMASLLHITPDPSLHTDNVNTVLSSIVQHQEDMNLFGGGK